MIETPATLILKDRHGRDVVAQLPSLRQLVEFEERLQGGTFTYAFLAQFFGEICGKTAQEVGDLFDVPSLTLAVRKIAAAVRLATPRPGSLDDVMDD